MKVEIYYKNYSAPRDFESVITESLNKMEKYFIKNPQAKVTLSKQRELVKAEISLHVNNTYLRGEKSAKDARSAFDDALSAIERQLIKYKEKLSHKDAKALKRESFDQFIEPPVFNVVRNKKFQILPMSVEDAILEMELGGHSFFMFIDEQNNQTSVVYKRNDGDYGLISPKE